VNPHQPAISGPIVMTHKISAVARRGNVSAATLQKRLTLPSVWKMIASPQTPTTKASGASAGAKYGGDLPPASEKNSTHQVAARIEKPSAGERKIAIACCLLKTK
jgi:hypothetical protein